MSKSNLHAPQADAQHRKSVGLALQQTQTFLPAFGYRLINLIYQHGGGKADETASEKTI